MTQPLRLFLVFFSLAVLTVSARAQEAKNAAPTLPFLSPLFSENAVLQRDRIAPIWGWTTPNSNVTVALGAKKFTARSDATGKWMAKLSAHPAGGPHTLSVTGAGANESVTLKNVMFGDVWLCSGQSNMAFPVPAFKDAKAEIAAANFPSIRFITMPNVTALVPQNTFQGAWKECSPQTVPGLSAVAYFFGRKVHQETGVPIGLISSSWSATAAEAWVSESGLDEVPGFQNHISALKAEIAETVPYEQRLANWWAANDSGVEDKWNVAATADTEWKTMSLPGAFDNADGPLPNYDGFVWFRREVEVPAAWEGKELALNIGPVDDTQAAFWNGAPLRASSGEPWVYAVPGKLVEAGKNLVAISVLDRGGRGGIFARPGELSLTAAGEPPLSLMGLWRYKESTSLDKLSAYPTRFQDNQNVVTVLYNGMIAPLTSAAIKGAIWYQGEANHGRGVQYQALLPALISDWRSRFASGDFPFYIVQLANYRTHDEQPHDDQDWTRLQYAQLLVSQKVPNTGLAVINDVGDEKDIHPQNKQDVGLRLALLALAKDYGKKVEYSGPTLKSHTVQGNKIVLKFDHATGGLTLKGDANRVFAIAGEDKKFVWATPVIQGDTITVSSPEVPNPVAVRFAWSNNPRATLHNDDGLPASLFRTDSW